MDFKNVRDWFNCENSVHSGNLHNRFGNVQAFFRKRQGVRSLHKACGSGGCHVNDNNFRVAYCGNYTDIYSRAGADEEYLTVLFKALGICYITQFACDICKDSGENALATQAELAGKISLMVIALPLFESLADIVAKLI